MLVASVSRREELTAALLPDASAESSPACADPKWAAPVAASRAKSHLPPASCHSPKASAPELLLPSQSLAVSVSLE
jgi:hypothetical protein